MVQEHAGEELFKVVGERDGIEPIDPELAMQYLTQLALGVAYMHSRNVYHRDLKLQNVALSKGADGSDVRPSSSSAPLPLILSYKSEKSLCGTM